MEGNGSGSSNMCNISSAPNQHTMLRLSSKRTATNSGHITSSLYSQLTVTIGGRHNGDGGGGGPGEGRDGVCETHIIRKHTDRKQVVR